MQCQAGCQASMSLPVVLKSSAGGMLPSAAAASGNVLSDLPLCLLASTLTGTL